MRAGQPNIGLCRHVALILSHEHGRDVVDRAVQYVGLPHPLQVSASIPVPVEMEAAFFQAAADLSNDIDLPLRAGLALGHAAALPGYVARNASTVREAMAAGSRSLSVVRKGLAVSVKESDGMALLDLSVTDPGLRQYPRHLECVFAGIIGQIRAFTARPFNPTGMSFQHERVPAGGKVVSEAGCTITFGSARNAINCTSRALDREIRGRDDALYALLVAHTEFLAQEVEQKGMSFAEQVELHLQSRLPLERRGVSLDADGVARALNISRRTLTRRLKEAGTNFSDILARVRVRIASRHLRETNQQVSEIASRLGYSSSSAFALAFRRATGQSPSEFRRDAVLVRE